jgi:ABC-type antimicrobial peptide transport system permease subunit
VGISEGSDKSFTYIPSGFASQLMNSYISNEISARNGNAIPSDDQNSVYLGLVYDGVTVEKDDNSSIFAGIRRQVNAQVEQQFSEVNEQIESQNQQIAQANTQNSNLQREFADSLERPQPGQGMGGGLRFPSMVHINSVSNLDAGNIKISYPGSSNTYTIPGLVYEQDRATSEILGEYTAFDFENSTIPLATNTILIKLDDIAYREQVVSDLNEKGFNYQDYSQYKAYEQLESQLSVILNVASIIFMVISALFVLINMAKFVSEGKREIGIFRAIGATQGDIRTLFILQSLMYILLSIGFGLISGYLLINLISSPMAGYAQELLNNITGGGITLAAGITAQSFLSFNAELILIYSAVLIFVTLIVSLIPANQAAKISPVEAIRNA